LCHAQHASRERECPLPAAAQASGRTGVREHMQAVDVLGRRVRPAARDRLGRRAVREALRRREHERAAAAAAAAAVAARVARGQRAVRAAARQRRR